VKVWKEWEKGGEGVVELSGENGLKWKAQEVLFSSVDGRMSSGGNVR